MIIATALGEPLGGALLKEKPEDFQVEEILGFELSGEGEHHCLQIEKRGLNTAEVVRRLRDVTGLPERSIAWCGLKDRHAVTRQWFSVHLPGKDDPQLGGLESEELRVLQHIRHRKKLKIGSHQANRFHITLKECVVDEAALTERIDAIRLGGFPNAFGSQRFGHGQENIADALKWFDKIKPLLERGKRIRPNKRESFLISVSRSMLFNALLGKRIESANWNSALKGDVFQFDDGTALFKSEIDEDLIARLARGEVHPTGPLYGRGDSMADAAALELEAAVSERHALALNCLDALGVNASRRALRAMPRNLQHHYDGAALKLSFELKRGSYATAMLAEIVQAEDANSIA